MPPILDPCPPPHRTRPAADASIGRTDRPGPPTASTTANGPVAAPDDGAARQRATIRHAARTCRAPTAQTTVTARQDATFRPAAPTAKCTVKARQEAPSPAFGDRTRHPATARTTVYAQRAHVRRTRPVAPRRRKRPSRRDKTRGSGAPPSAGRTCRATPTQTTLSARQDPTAGASTPTARTCRATMDRPSATGTTVRSPARSGHPDSWRPERGRFHARTATLSGFDRNGSGQGLTRTSQSEADDRGDGRDRD